MSKVKNTCKQNLNKVDKVLLVEGKDDCHVVMSLCEARQVPEIFKIHECSGDEEVLKSLNPLIIRPDPPKVIGVMLDADDSVGNKWQSIRDKLSHYSYQFPILPHIDGTIIEGNVNEPKIGFWLMPNNQDSGKLEDFCAKLAELLSLKFARECVQEAEIKGVTTFKIVDRSKAIIHTYLAWQDEPGRPMGQAITKQALQPNTDIAHKFTNWLTTLFG